MKTVLIILSFIILAAVILFFILGNMSKSGEAKGLAEGRLSECPARPNCACSEDIEDIDQYIKPIRFPQNVPGNLLHILRTTILELDGTINSEGENYIASTFSSTIFGFVDDFEIRIDSAQNLIHLRSASRVGYSDAGVNRKRTELFRKLLNEKLEATTQTEKSSD